MSAISFTYNTRNCIFFNSSSSSFSIVTTDNVIAFNLLSSAIIKLLYACDLFRVSSFAIY